MLATLPSVVTSLRRVSTLMGPTIVCVGRVTSLGRQEYVKVSAVQYERERGFPVTIKVDPGFTTAPFFVRHAGFSNMGNDITPLVLILLSILYLLCGL